MHRRNLLRYGAGIAACAVSGTAAAISIDTAPEDRSTDGREVNNTRRTRTTPASARTTKNAPSETGSEEVPDSNSPSPTAEEDLIPEGSNASNISRRLNLRKLTADDHGVLNTAPAFVSAVKAENVSVVNWQRLHPPSFPQSPVYLSIYSKGRTVEHTQVAYITGVVYTEAVSDGLPAIATVVTIFDRRGSPFISYRIRRKWASSFINGELSNDEFASKISQTACPGACYSGRSSAK